MRLDRDMTPNEPISWEFPDPLLAGPEDVVAVGADLAPATLIAAYRRGLFPMHLPDDGPLGWWSPVERGIFPLGNLRVSRSLARSMRRYKTTVNRSFPAVVERCASQPRPHGWINDDIRRAYIEMHELGHAHSVETWRDGVLVGGLYGVSVGGLFAGESMFHDATDASKVALVRLVSIMSETAGALLDIQWLTDHLATLGAVEIERPAYLRLLAVAVDLPSPSGFSGATSPV